MQIIGSVWLLNDLRNFIYNKHISQGWGYMNMNNTIQWQ